MTINRRDFINGALVIAGSTLVPLDALSMTSRPNAYYPPALKGLRGSHPGSNTHAHARAWSQRSDWGPVTGLDEVYDLVVVGAGLSGLAAAHFFRQRHGQNARILILDNHDDFGGHAKRNEHEIDGKTLISFGGSQTIVEPSHADEVILNLFNDIGVDIKRFETAYDTNFYKRNGLGAVTYFNGDVFAEDKVVQHPFCNYPNYVERMPMGRLSHEEAARQAPLSEAGKRQLLNVLNGGLHKIDVPPEDLDTYVAETLYFDYLRDTLGVDDPGVLRMARHSGLDWASASTEMLTIEDAKWAGALGFAPKPVFDEDNPYIHHFPDGNAGVARALVKALIPKVARGKNAEDLVLAQFDYSQLDRTRNPVRIRLNSTVVNVEHNGEPRNADDVTVNYVRDDQGVSVKAKHVVMACYNMMVPHIVSGLPKAQSDALRQQDKSPLVYTTVGLRNWRAFKEQGIALAMSPGNRHQVLYMDFPVSLGGYNYTQHPDEPCVIQMISCPYGTFGDPIREQFSQARYEMLGLKFDDYEQEIRHHLGGMLGPSFKFDREVASITVNRWAHGYTVPGPGASVEIGRQPFGRITIANSDSAPEADAIAAMMMAHRAVGELS